jgi:copper resistance protein B
MKTRPRVFVVVIAAVLAVGFSASKSAAQEMPGMPGMKMPMPKAKPKAKAKSTVKTKPKTKTAAKQKTVSKTKPKPSSKTNPKVKPMEMNMPGMKMPSEMKTPSPTSTPQPPPTPPMKMEMPMNMPMPSATPPPSSSPTPSQSPMQMEMPMPSPSSSPVNMPSNMKMPVPSPTPPDFSDRPRSPLPPFPPPKDWESPVGDERPYFFLLADVFEFRPKGSDSDIRWDTEGWYGGDFNKIWFKSEGEKSTVSKDYNADFQLLYARFVKRYYDFQIGGRVESRRFRGANIARPQFVVGIEGLRPYRFELEAAAFVDPKGKVSGRVTYSRDYLMTQRLILQPRFETNLAIQKVERFGVGRGLNDIELGFRLRYEIRREFAPYIGFAYARSFFGAADFVRRAGGDPGQFRVVAGIRMWR